MTLGAPRQDRIDAAILPWVALGFSVFVAMLAPHYPVWFPDAMPQPIRVFLSFCPLWVVINAIAVVVSRWVKGMRSREGQFWRALDSVLALATGLIFVAGIVSLVVPAMSLRAF